MYSIIRLCIVLAAVLVVQAAADIFVFSEGGDPTPSDPSPTPDSEVVDDNDKCDGCIGNKPPDTYTGNANTSNGPFLLWPDDGGNVPAIEAGKCEGPDDNGKCDTGKCSLNHGYRIKPAWPHNGDSVTWEVQLDVPLVFQIPAWVVGPQDLKKATVVLPGQQAVKWDCGSSIKIVVSWKFNGAKRTRTKTLECTPCDPPKKKDN